MRYGLSAGIVLVFMIVLSSVLFPPMFTTHAQLATPEPVVERATPVPPTPTPIFIVIKESVSVGETNGKGGLDPITEAIAIEDSTSAVSPITESIVIEDSTSTINPITESIVIEASTSTINPINETIAIEDSTPVIHLLTETMSADDQKAEQASREKKSKDPFDRSTGAIKESGVKPVSETPDEAAMEADKASGGGGSIWLIVVYVVVGLVVAGSLAVLGRRFIRAGTPR